MLGVERRAARSRRASLRLPTVELSILCEPVAFLEEARGWNQLVHASSARVRASYYGEGGLLAWQCTAHNDS